MVVQRYCTTADCPGDKGCTNELRHPDKPCIYEYVAQGNKYDWQGEGNPPNKWRASDGTLVYRSYSDYCED